jgi:hypothetical protein
MAATAGAVHYSNRSTLNVDASIDRNRYNEAGGLVQRPQAALIVHPRRRGRHGALDRRKVQIMNRDLQWLDGASLDPAVGPRR